MFSTHFSKGIQRPSVTTDDTQNVLLGWSVNSSSERMIGSLLMAIGVLSILYLLVTGKTGTVGLSSGAGPGLSTGVFMHLAISFAIILWGYVSFRHPYYQVGRKRVTDPLQQITFLPAGWLVYSVPMTAALFPFLNSETRHKLIIQAPETMQQPWWMIGLVLIVFTVLIYILYWTTVYWLWFTRGIIRAVKYDSRLRSTLIFDKEYYQRGNTVNFQLEPGTLIDETNYRIFLLGVGTRRRKRTFFHRKRSIREYRHVDFQDAGATEIEQGLFFTLPDHALSGPESGYQQWEILIEEHGSDYWLRYQLPAA